MHVHGFGLHVSHDYDYDSQLIPCTGVKWERREESAILLMMGANMIMFSYRFKGREPVLRHDDEDEGDVRMMR
jgi:hypothetical protein